MNKKTIYIVVAVLVVVIIVAAAGILLYTSNPNNGTTNPTPTPAPTPANVTGASTLQFSVNDTTTSTGDVVGYSFACKNYDTATEVVRVDLCVSGANYSYILDAGQQKSWASTDGGVTWTASTFGTTTGDWATYGSLFNTFVGKLASGWSGLNDYSYTTSTSSVVIYCISVNGNIPSSTFATT